MSSIYLLNFLTVSVFGMILAAAFCDITWTRGKCFFLGGSLAAILIFQGSVYFFMDMSLAQSLYPLTTHLPLALVLCVLSRRRLWPFISVLTAYLCCQIRRWAALFITALFAGGPVTQSMAEMAVTLPVLMSLVWLAAPSVRSVSGGTMFAQCQFGLIPAIYYGFDYLTRIYTDLLLEGVMVAVEFRPFVCCMSYLAFILHTSAANRVRMELEQTQNSLNIQVVQAVREIEALRESQQKTSVHRHDLRHHMQYLLSCLENGRTEQAQAYIQNVCSELEANKVTVFCENETITLICSAFVRRAEKYGISIAIRAVVPPVVPVSESDLCVLLSNAMENALHACQRMKKKGAEGRIEAEMFERKGKFFVQVVNSCDEEPSFVKGVPVTDVPGHGIGVRSICAIVEKYGGIYQFQVLEGRFVMQVSF